ncbi:MULTISPECIES: hypothetical protein [Paenarthrobacter]|uniref:Uncharacterized protein n=1 Tax=Paenarthrobacter ureafaciens TaxID=37931 RepID=A0AAX3EFE4_PAEUR|nr:MULTISPECIES: hypothetical protein [Paenarthrobacter]MDO5865853.1 hypothetical protein [Paenarthrobacter sp. SD-2]MDO5876947.1 hypothetical protein [Paenarthrobacter sp. SD-1]QMU83581.1 hypothetical protein FV140_16915 [Paenarthrobacter ureafaciens]UYV92157.1 hypothetical protein NL395_16770 [Paenarthrobacter ureafaciens]UYV96693.1 hypothetical protein NL394_16800 [Paenarthrobacter ureafaciens]
MAVYRAESFSPPSPRARHFIAAALAAAALLLGFLHGQPARAAVTPVYPISGYFIYGSTSDAVNTKKLTDIKSVGGDTVITFGSRLKPATLSSIPTDCKISGVNCATAAASGVKVKRYFTYSDGSSWGAKSFICARDKTVTAGSVVYTIMVLPVEGSGCNSPSGTYDVVVINGGTNSLSVSVGKAATDLGMKYYAGLPAPINRTDVTYLPDLSYQATLSLFTARFLIYQSNVNNVPGLAGFYHHTEMPLSDGAVWEPVLSLYRMQNSRIAQYQPGRTAVVSPYIDSRSAFSGRVTVSQARNAANKIAKTSNGVKMAIAVQDGMGTGKGGSFFSSESNNNVDSFAASIVGSGSWGSKYLAPTRDYFWALSEGVRGTNAQLWANLEGMAPLTSQNPCDNSTRGQTTKARIDKQVQQLGNTPVKVISFMWDPYFTCTGTWTPMLDRLKAGGTTPLITDSIFYGNGDVLVTGHNLSGGTIRVQWTDTNGWVQDKTVTASNYNPSYGKQLGINPLLESVTAKLGNTSLGIGKHYFIDVVNGSGVKNDALYSDRG